MAFFAVASYAQNRLITGSLSDRDTKDPLTQTTVQLLRAKDSTFVAGTISNNEGKFSVKANDDGRYIVRITSIGYKTVVKRLNIANSGNVDLGKIILGSDAVMLKGATVVGQAAKVTLKEDTFVYNSSAYRTPEGSTIEELVKRLPGAQISDDGTITINGKQVKKILVEGKEFMTGDTKTALKNIPTSVINKIKAYDKKSDLAKVTGIAVASYAQNRLILGNLSDRDTKEPLMQTTVQLLEAKDSTFVAGAISNNDGNFSVKANSDGHFIIRITSVGYKTVIKYVNIANSSNVDLGKIILGSNAVMLKGATIVGQAAKVTLKEDTCGVVRWSSYHSPLLVESVALRMIFHAGSSV